MDVLPPELLLYLFSLFPLTSLIAARGVNAQWRSCAQTASLHPARKALLDLYLAAIVHPNFPSLVAALRPHVREFDREAYVADLASRGCVLPDVFKLWVLEWPSTAIHFWAWPGLPRDITVDHEYYYDGGNLLGNTGPIIETVPVPTKEAASAGKTQCRGLALRSVEFWGSNAAAQVWLVVDAHERLNDRRAGSLLYTYTYYVGGPDGTEGPMHICYDPPIWAENFVDFLDLLDLNRGMIEWTLEGYYLVGPSETD